MRAVKAAAKRRAIQERADALCDRCRNRDPWHLDLLAIEGRYYHVTGPCAAESMLRDEATQRGHTEDNR